MCLGELRNKTEGVSGGLEAPKIEANTLGLLFERERKKE